jgi:DNA polymerase-3 subunit alpha
MIQQMGFSGYFLIVWDFIRSRSKNSRRAGPAAGSLVSYSMEIPISIRSYGLLFERFLNRNAFRCRISISISARAAVAQ